MSFRGGNAVSQKSVDVRVARLASRRYGVLSREEAIRAGATGKIIWRRVADGLWVRLHPSVFVLAGVSRSWQQQLAAAVLAGGLGTVASHRAAAEVFLLPGAQPVPVEISLSRGKRFRAPGIIAHHVGDLSSADVAIVDAISVTTPTRTLIDLGAVVPAEVVEDALDDALRRKMTSIERLQRRLEALRRRGRPGIAVIEDLIKARDGTKVPESSFETRLLRVLREGGLPPVCQYEVMDGEEFVARVDFAYPEHKVAVEADGYAAHSGRRDWEHDLKRRNRLMALDWLLIHVTWTDLTRHPDRVVDEVSRALARRSTLATTPPAGGGRERVRSREVPSVRRA